MSADLVLVTDDGEDLPRAMQDAQTLNLLQPQVDAVEEGTRFHPNGITEQYKRIEFR